MGRRPLSRRDEIDSEYDALHEGVPPWLKGTLLDWLRSVFYPFGRYGREVDPALLRETERRVRDLVLGVTSDDSVLLRTCIQQLEADDELLLDVLDFVLSKARVDHLGGMSREARELSAALEQGGSVWRVARYPDSQQPVWSAASMRP